MSKKLQFLPVVYVNHMLGKGYETAEEITTEDWIRALGAVILAAAGVDALEFRDRVARVEELARQYDYLEVIEED
jgi:hypothetical protein